MTKQNRQSKSSQKTTRPDSGPPNSGKPAGGWEWAPFTKRSHEFTHAARVLASSLKEAYGDTVSISQFEKFIAAIPSMTVAQRDLLYVDPKIVVLLQDYRTARALRDGERDYFRGDIKIVDVNAGLEALRGLGLLIEEHGPTEEEVKEDE